MICGTTGNVLIAAEFKYEPSRHRAEFGAMPGKLPVVSWAADGVAKDLARIREFVDTGTVRKAFALLIDEGRYFRDRPRIPRDSMAGLETIPAGRPLTVSPAGTVAAGLTLDTARLGCRRY